MDSSKDGGFVFLHGWSDDLDPAGRRVRIPHYLPSGDASVVAARPSGGGGAADTVEVTALSLAAAWLMLRAK